MLLPGSYSIAAVVTSKKDKPQLIQNVVVNEDKPTIMENILMVDNLSTTTDELSDFIARVF